MFRNWYFYGIKQDRQVTVLDLLANRSYNDDHEGDFSVKITDEDRGMGVTPRFLWTVECRAYKGGLIERQADDRDMWMAPVAGYHDQLVWKGSANQPGLRLAKRLIIKSRNGEVHGSILFEVVQDRNGSAVVYVTGYLNTGHSRNLQPNTDRSNVFEGPEAMQKIEQYRSRNNSALPKGGDNAVPVVEPAPSSVLASPNQPQVGGGRNFTGIEDQGFFAIVLDQDSNTTALPRLKF